MFELTREVRLVLPLGADEFASSTINGHAGYPGGDSLACFVTVQATLAGEPDPTTGYLINIKDVDRAIRGQGFEFLRDSMRKNRTAAAEVARGMFDLLAAPWPNMSGLRLGLSPYTSVSIEKAEHPMVRLSRKFEFSAAHRLHNPDLTPQANVDLFGKCNNPHGHGHNYELEVTIAGKSPSTSLIPIDKLDQIVFAQVIQKFDHKFLNIETPEFSTLNPTVENIAATIHHLLKAKLAEAGATLAAVTVWETPKTSCRYSE